MFKFSFKQLAVSKHMTLITNKAVGIKMAAVKMVMT